jgi:hypothetical protein
MVYNILIFYIYIIIYLFIFFYFIKGFGIIWREELGVFGNHFFWSFWGEEFLEGIVFYEGGRKVGESNWGEVAW